VAATAELSARAAALAPPHAHGVPLARAQLRLAAEDFLVEEELSFTPAGSGAHVLVKVRKVNANTQWVARELARLARCRPAEVGYAGLKDRRAVALQWFSLPRPRAPLDWCAVRTADFAVLEAHAHTRKLPRGALSGNRFAIRLRAPDGGATLATALAPRLAAIARCGVPNYFGPQRFGHAGANLVRSGQELRGLRRQERGFVLSAARSVVFNALLAARVTAGTWEQLLAGDLANLEGRGSFFAVDSADATLAERCARLEIHPTGPLWGQGSLETRGAVAELEAHVAGRFSTECAACEAAGMRQERRSLRLAVHELRVAEEPGAIVLHFQLGRGSYATAVLRELIEFPQPSGEG
jgi:tRNA pseudouridine13 synthase